MGPEGPGRKGFEERWHCRYDCEEAEGVLQWLQGEDHPYQLTTRSAGNFGGAREGEETQDFVRNSERGRGQIEKAKSSASGAASSAAAAPAAKEQEEVDQEDDEKPDDKCMELFGDLNLY